MKPQPWISPLFWLAAVYDGILGIVFLVSPLAVFNAAGVVPPNHIGYVQFPAALVLVFAIMFTQIAMNPTAGRVFIPYGILLKLSYVGVVAGHWIATDIPGMWKPFAVADAAFAVLFLLAYFALRGDALSGQRIDKTSA